MFYEFPSPKDRGEMYEPYQRLRHIEADLRKIQRQLWWDKFWSYAGPVIFCGGVALLAYLACEAV